MEIVRTCAKNNAKASYLNDSLSFINTQSTRGFRCFYQRGFGSCKVLIEIGKHQ